MSIGWRGVSMDADESSSASDDIGCSLVLGNFDKPAAETNKSAWKPLCQ